MSKEDNIKNTINDLMDLMGKGCLHPGLDNAIILLRSFLMLEQQTPFAYYANEAYYNSVKAALKDGAEEVLPLYTNVRGE